MTPPTLLKSKKLHIATREDLRKVSAKRTVARVVYSIGIVVCVLCVNVFIVVEELWEGLETAKLLPWVTFRG